MKLISTLCLAPTTNPGFIGRQVFVIITGNNAVQGGDSKSISRFSFVWDTSNSHVRPATLEGRLKCLPLQLYEQH